MLCDQENKDKISQIDDEYIAARNAEDLPESMNDFGFHDREIESLCVDHDVVILLKKDEYEQEGYEAHMLFAGDNLAELIVICDDIIMEKER